MKNTICYYDKHIICAYLDPEQQSEINFHACCTCPHCHPVCSDMPETSGRSGWGALIAVLPAFAVFLSILRIFSEMIRP